MVATTSDLHFAGYNPRTISAESLGGLRNSLSAFGDLGGIVYNKTTGNLVSGHQRLTALMADYGELPVVDGCITTPDGDKFVVRFVEWSLEKEKAANIAANNPAIQGDFTDELQTILLELQSAMPDDDFTALRFDELINTDALFAQLNDDFRGYDPDKGSSSGDYVIGGTQQDHIRYSLIFDTIEQKQMFEQFVEKARLLHPNGTIAQSLCAYISGL